MNTHAQHKALADRVSDVLLSALSTDEAIEIMDDYSVLLEKATVALMLDLNAYVNRDPASSNQEHALIKCSTSFLAVICYRLSHYALQLSSDKGVLWELLPQRLCAHAKMHSGIEINPSAKIGKRFVIDHGCGTVIGETAVIGNDCYILSNVILGARGISRNSAGKRHPTIGHGVEIGCGARILGPITIGDNVFIAPSCVVTDNIPNKGRVTVVNQLQVCRTSNQSRHINISAYAKNSSLFLVGELEQFISVELINENYEPYLNLKLQTNRSQNNQVEYLIVCDELAVTESSLPESFPTESTLSASSKNESSKLIHLLLKYQQQEIVLINPDGLLSAANRIIDMYKTKNEIKPIRVEVA